LALATCDDMKAAAPFRAAACYCPAGLNAVAKHEVPPGLFPSKSSFATVRHLTVRSKGCLSNKTALAMIFKLAEAVEKNWRRLDGHNQLPKIILFSNFPIRHGGDRFSRRPSACRVRLWKRVCVASDCARSDHHGYSRPSTGSNGKPSLWRSRYSGMFSIIHSATSRMVKSATSKLARSSLHFFRGT
jgi:hypothetical protein